MRYLLLIMLPVFLFACNSSGTDTTSTTEAIPPARDAVTDHNPDNDKRPLSELIQIDGISPGATIGSPFIVTGKAKSAWYFEGDFPVILKDENGHVLSKSPAAAQSRWTAVGWIPFKADIIFIAAPGTKANLEFKLDNPSETEGYQRSVSIPVILK